MNKRSYLGDGVYADVDRPTGGLILTTDNGLRTTNVIVLEPEVLSALLAYVERLRAPKDMDWHLEPGEEGP